MCPDHRVDKPNSCSNSCGCKGRKASKEIGSKKDSAEDCWVGAKTDIEPVGKEALHHQPAGKRIKHKQPGEAQHYRTRAVEAKQALRNALWATCGKVFTPRWFDSR